MMIRHATARTRYGGVTAERPHIHEHTGVRMSNKTPDEEKIREEREHREREREREERQEDTRLDDEDH